MARIKWLYGMVVKLDGTIIEYNSKDLQEMNLNVFVFGSNEAGRHGAGAALIAFMKHGAAMGVSYGHMGASFAIPTKDQTVRYPLPLPQINDYVRGFLAYAKGHPEHRFKVTRIGCGLAGHRDTDIAPMFMDAPNNCTFDTEWELLLTPQHRFWGTF